MSDRQSGAGILVARAIGPFGAPPALPTASAFRPTKRSTLSSGQSAEVAIDGRNITHWLSRAPRQNPWMPWLYGQTWDATLAWEGCTKSGEPVNIQAYEWVNPRPDDPIASVEMTAKQDVAGLKLGLVALTVVR